MFGHAKNAKRRSFEAIFQEHIALAEMCAAKLMQLFISPSNVEGRIREIVDLEHEGDRLTKETYHTLDRSFMTRIEKPDIQALIHQLDEILDGLHDAAYLIEIFDIKEVREEAKDLVSIIQDMVRVLKEKIILMPRLTMEQSQEGHARLDVMETLADEKWRKGMKRAYADLDSKEYLAWERIFDVLEETTNRCLKAGSVVDSIVRKDSH